MLTDFSEDKIVQIDSVPAKYDLYHEKLYGQIGTIKEIVSKPDKERVIGVCVKGVENQKSSKGYFWFRENEIIIKGDSTMNIENYNNHKFCTVTKPGNSGYTGILAYVGELKPGDYVVCNNGYYNGALSVRIVTAVNISRDAITVLNIDGEVMGVADVKDYFDRKDKEEKLVELKKQMKTRAKLFQEESFWKFISEQDDVMNELYNEYKELIK